MKEKEGTNSYLGMQMFESGTIDATNSYRKAVQHKLFELRSIDVLAHANLDIRHILLTYDIML